MTTSTPPTLATLTEITCEERRFARRIVHLEWLPGRKRWVAVGESTATADPTDVAYHAFLGEHTRRPGCAPEWEWRIVNPKDHQSVGDALVATAASTDFTSTTREVRRALTALVEQREEGRT